MDVDMGPALFDNNNVSMPKMDAEIIEALWKQDIDMGITREDRFPNKMEVEIEKPEPIDKQIQQFDIDCETGEYLPRVQPPVSTPATTTTEATPTVTDEGSVFENFLTDLLDGYSPDGGEAPSNTSSIPQLTDALEIEQRWQDLASLSEFQTSPLQNSSGSGENPISDIPQNSFPNTTWNNSVPSSDQDVFAFNATTNGNVNLQNATGPQLPPLFNGTAEPLTTNGLLQNEDLGNQFLSTINDTQMNMNTSHEELFSPISRFNSMSISRELPPSPASSQGSSINLTMLMMDQQALELPPVESPQAQPRPTSVSPVARPNGSLLLELLNATDANSSNASDEMEDSDMQELDSVIEMLTANNDTHMDLLSDDDSFSIGDSESVEGATGFNRDIFKGEFKRYNRGGDSPCYSDAGSSSSYESSGNSDNIHHNHSYAASSDSESLKGGVRSSNGSRNGTSDGAGSGGRISRDERRAKEMGVPFSVSKIINLPVDSFNELIKQHELTNEQMQLIRDIRRRGKNKVAAQNCRKRKISAIHQVEGSVGAMQNEHDKLLKERDKVSREMETMQERFDDLYRQVFNNMRDRRGEPVDPDEYRLEVMDDGSVILVPRNDTGSGLTGGRVTDKESNSN